VFSGCDEPIEETIHKAVFIIDTQEFVYYNQFKRLTKDWECSMAVNFAAAKACTGIPCLAMPMGAAIALAVGSVLHG
jgi:hypothetical protein